MAKPLIRANRIVEELARKSRERRDNREGQVALEAVRATGRNDLVPTFEFEHRAIDTLSYPSRVMRNIDPAHVAEIGRSIQHFGVSALITINRDGKVIDGISTIEAAKALGIKELPCAVVGHLSENEQTLLRLTLNRLGEKGGWNIVELKDTYIEIRGECDFVVTGFEPQILDSLVLDGAASQFASADACPALGSTAVNRLHDMWILGEHRLLCGDALLSESYKRLFAAEERARVVITDSPFNCEIDGFVGGKGEHHHRSFVMASGELSPEEFECFLSAYLANCSAFLVPGGLLFNFMDHRQIETLLRAGRSLGFRLLNIAVWNKGRGAMGGLYRSAHELIAIFKSGDEAHLDRVKLGKFGRDRTNVWTFPGAVTRGSSANRQLKNHPTPKSVEMIEETVLDVTQRGDIVLDPFMGSGTTLIAARKADRRAFGMELDPLYCDLIVRRYQTFTGIDAVHAETGLTFEAMARQRASETASEKNDLGRESDGAGCEEADFESGLTGRSAMTIV